MMTPEEKLELAELLAYRTRSAFEIRRGRLKAAEMRLGMWENGRFVGNGLAELVEKARHGKPLTRDEWIVTHVGFSNPGELQSFLERKEMECRKFDGVF
jgi:hypothetical protein